jgi:uncharacterized caspase-like protein
VALFYFSGHGIQVKGENFVLPVDFDAHATEMATSEDAYSVQKLEHFMEDAGAKVRILILDACRDNPLRASKGMTRGLARMEGAEGSFIAFAAAEGTNGG